MTLRLFMHLLCTILCHDISNNHSTPLCFHAHYLGFTWYFRVKHRRTYIPYIVFSYISLAHMDVHLSINKVQPPTWLRRMKIRNSYQSLLHLLAKRASQPPLYLGSIIHIESIVPHSHTEHLPILILVYQPGILAPPPSLIMTDKESSVRYGASRAPKNSGPRPNSPPRPAERPGVGCVSFRVPCPCPRPHPFPRRVPVKTGGEKRGPVQGMSGDSPRTGAGRGSPPK